MTEEKEKQNIFGHLVNISWNLYLISMAIGIIGIIGYFIVRIYNPSTITKLGSNYTYYKGIDNIWYEYPQKRGEAIPRQKEMIPSNVLSYNYNSNFIIALQKPKEYDEAYDTKYAYPLGRDTVYYWLIIKEKQKAIGPLDSTQFCEARKKYNVPDKLVRKMKPLHKTP